MRFFLAADGTRGDVQPLLALAIALQAKGHNVALAATPGFRCEVERFDVPFHAFGLDLKELLQQHAEIATQPVAMWRFFRKHVRSQVHAQFDVLRRHAKQADVVASAGIFFAGSSVAESFGIPFRYVAYTPQYCPSAYHPPISVASQILPRFVNRAGWFLFRLRINLLVGPWLNEEREALGLPRVRDAFYEITRADRLLIASDPEIAPLPPDVAGACSPTGAWHLTDDRALGADVDAFLRAGEAPVYIGFGSMPDASPDATAKLIVNVVDAVGCRAIVCGGWARIGHEIAHPRILSIDAAPHAKLFPRVAAVIHHGGAGTTAAAARAGVPQVIVPHLLDQFRWAHYAQSSGVGTAPLSRTRLTAEALALRLREVLTNAPMRDRAVRIGGQLRARDGLEAAVSELERVGQERPRRASPSLMPSFRPLPSQ
jgi:UDP:flavonoid glycosyltransferase YjiC (YdhE family)